MAANNKKNDLKAAKDRRNKKILIVGSVFLAAILAIQVPRTMKMLGGPETATPPAVAAPVSTPAPATDPTAVPVAAEKATLTNVDVAPEPEAGQLASLGQFSSKDPFVQQVSDGSSSEAAPTSPPSASTPSATPGPSAGVSVTVPSVPSVGTTPGSPSSGATPAAATPTSAVLAVNGVEQTVSVKSDFPEDDPTFRLVALTAKSAKIGIAGGTLATGAGTVTVKVGKTVTLMNTVDGTRYEIQLQSVS